MTCEVNNVIPWGTKFVFLSASRWRSVVFGFLLENLSAFLKKNQNAPRPSEHPQ